MKTTLIISCLMFGVALSAVRAQDADSGKKTGKIVKEDFEKGADRWEPTDKDAWKISKDGDRQVYELTKKNSDYKPKHRSPLNIALLKGEEFGDFVLTAKVKTTEKSYGHRSMCLFFGHQDASHFYYVHFGQQMDDHANQIFIVNDAPRTKISTKTTKGTPWQDDTWHKVRIERSVSEGTIKVYFDNMKEPIMEATDKTFAKGRVGVGSFDDTGMWDDIRVRRSPKKAGGKKKAKKQADEQKEKKGE